MLHQCANLGCVDYIKAEKTVGNFNFIVRWEFSQWCRKSIGIFSLSIMEIQHIGLGKKQLSSEFYGDNALGYY